MSDFLGFSKAGSKAAFRRGIATLLTVGLLTTGFLSGCSLTPQLVRPAAPVADSFPNAAANNDAGAKRAVDTDWREFFTDPRLRP